MVSLGKIARHHFKIKELQPIQNCFWDNFRLLLLIDMITWIEGQKWKN